MGNRAVNMAQRPTRLLMVAGLVAVTMLFGMVYVLFTGTRLAAMHIPLVNATQKIKLETTIAHLWFEEIVGGDRRQPIEDVWAHLDEAEWYARAMIAGGANREGAILQLEDPALTDQMKGVLRKLRAFRNVANQRLQARSVSGPGSGYDQAFDAIFETFMNQADSVETAVRQTIEQQQKAFRRTQALLIGAFVLLASWLGWLFREYARARWRAEAERENALLELAQTRKLEAVGVLAGGVAHDFNNLLTTISGYVELALDKIPTDHILHEDLTEVQKAADRATRLTRQLLLFSHKQPLKFVTIDLNRSVANLGGMFARIIGEHVEVQTELCNAIWPIQADTGSIDQAIVNLVINARDSMPEGGRVEIRTENVTVTQQDVVGHPDARTGRFVNLSIRDTGTGMDQETRERIFEPFFTTKGRAKGTGLGLSVVHGIVQQHGGWIDVTSVPGKGSTFRLFLPAGGEFPAEEPAETTEPLPAPAARKTILAVEDDASLREFARHALARSGYEVLTAATIDEALAVIQRNKTQPDLVFSDVVLPDGSGIDLVLKIRSSRPGIRLLLTSGYPEGALGWKRIEAERFHFIQKPYTVTDLLRTIAEIFRQGTPPDRG